MSSVTAKKSARPSALQNRVSFRVSFSRNLSICCHTCLPMPFKGVDLKSERPENFKGQNLKLFDVHTWKGSCKTWRKARLLGTAVCCSELQCVVACCSVVQCVAACHSVSQCVALCCIVLHCVVVCCSVLQCVAVRCIVLHCVAVCCSLLQCVAGCCSVLPHTKGACKTWLKARLLSTAAAAHATRPSSFASAPIGFTVCCVLQCVAVCCSVLQCVAVCCSVYSVL